jgi:prepilin-type N-terminal cleavage/methylation domain-containing protein
MHLIARLRTLRRDDDGFSLVELLAAMAVGGVILTALMGVFVSGVRGTTAIQNRVDNAGRARFTLDRIVRLLDSQVCVPLVATSDLATPPVFANSNNNSVTFFGDLNGASSAPKKYVITYTPKSGSARGTLAVDTYADNGSKTWPTKVGVTNVVASDIVPVKNAAGVAQPIFTYYPYIAAPAGPDVGTVSTTPAVTPLSVADAPRIVKVGVQFAAISSTSHIDNNRQHAYVGGSGTVATFDADPLNPTACPQ